MARVEFEIAEGTVVARYEVLGTRIYWNAVVRRDRLLGQSVGGNTAFPADANASDVLKEAVVEALSARPSVLPRREK